MQHHARSVYHLSEARLHDSPGHLQDPLLDGFYLEVGAGDTLRRGRHKHFARRREYAPGRREEYRARNVRTDILAQALYELCLLYTSDAADDLLCVDLGGRRIIKK